MLHSSVLIQSILFILKQLEKYYDQSFLHRLFVNLFQGMATIFSGSFVFGFFGEMDGLFRSSFAFVLLRFIYRFVNTLITWIRIHIFEGISYSKLFRFIESFKSLDLFLAIGALLNLGFGLSLLVIFVLSKRSQGLLGLAFIGLGLFCFLLSNNSREKIGSSKLLTIFAPFYKVFLRDEEAEEWNN